jgi:hypothetical protein
MRIPILPGRWATGPCIVRDSTSTKHKCSGGRRSQATIGRSRASLEVPWKMIWFERIRLY